MPKVVDHDEQREGLSRCAAQLIATVGLENVSLRKIAEAYGCTKGMVQYYFADKEALLLNALLYVTDRYMERRKAAAGALRGLALIESHYMVLLPLTRELHDEWVVRTAFYSRASTVPSMQRVLTQHYRRDLRAGVRDLEVARSMNELRPGVDLTNGYRLIVSAVGGVGMAAVMNPRHIRPRDQIQILKDSIDSLRP